MKNALMSIGGAFLMTAIILGWFAGGIELMAWATKRFGNHFHVVAIVWTVYCFMPGLLLVAAGAML